MRNTSKNDRDDDKRDDQDDNSAQSAGFLGGISLGVNAMHLGSRNFRNSKGIAYTGLISGTAQIVLGLANIREDDLMGGINMYPVRASYKAQNNLSYFNIAMGTTTVLTSAVNLWMNKKMKDRKTSLNLYSHPGINNKLVAGVSFLKKM